MDGRYEKKASADNNLKPHKGVFSVVGSGMLTNEPNMILHESNGTLNAGVYSIVKLCDLLKR